MSSIDVRLLDRSNRNDFYRVHCDGNDAGWCNCIAWWVPTWQGWDIRTGEENRRLRDALFDAGEYDGYLLYADDTPVGWCQAGPRDRLEKLVRQFGLAPDPEAWAITCFFVVPSARRRGLARRLLHDVLNDLRRRGARRVEAFPKRGTDMEEGELWTGPESLYLEMGFVVEHEHPVAPVLRLELAPADADRRHAESAANN